MEAFVFVISVSIAVLLIVVLVSGLRTKGLNDTMSRLASRYRGTVSPGDILNLPSLRFPYRDARVLVDYYSTGAGEHKAYYTQVKVFGHIPRTRCEIYPEGIWSSLGKLVGFHDISIGNPRFDHDYVIRGENTSTTHSILTPAVQQQINALRSLRGNGDIYVALNHGMLHVRKRSLMRDYGSLQELIEQSLRLYDLVTTVSEDGIDFVTQTEVDEAWTEAICQVCGEVIRENAVVCKQCGTPHHEECWQYYGACSTYGCKETYYRFPRRPNEASLVQPPPDLP